MTDDEVSVDSEGGTAAARLEASAGDSGDVNKREGGGETGGAMV